MSPSRAPRRSAYGTAWQVDAALQPERTTLAWSRTSLACVVVSAVCLRFLPFYGPALLLLPALTLVAALAITTTHRRRTRRWVRAIHGERLDVDPRPMAALLALTVALGCTGLVLVALA